MRKDYLNKEEVGEGVPNRLVDKLRESAKDFERFALGRRLGLVLSNPLERKIREDHCPMAICFEVNAYVKLRGGVMEVFDTSGSADNRKLKMGGDVVCACAIGICRLDDAHLELFRETSAASEVSDEKSGKSGNAITVEEVKNGVGVDEVVHDAVCIAVQRGAAAERGGLRGGWCALTGFDVVGPAL